jgi:signal transduction histidine kinase
MRDLLADADGETDGVRLAVLLRRLGLDGSMSGSGDLPAPIEREVASRGAGSRVVRIAFGRLLEASSRGRRARLLTLSCLDVTEFRRFEETLQAATARAEEASRMKSTFLANMSHELRTPLNAILGFSEILAAELFGPLGSGRYLDYVRDIHAAGGHLLSLVDDILDLSRLSSGGRQLDLGPVDLAAALGAAASMVSANARSRGVALSFDRPETGVTVLADERAVRQVALNLLTNAIKFTPSGGRVTMRIEVGERSVVFEVADTGAGIPSDQLDAVFRPFHQVSAVQSRDHGGAGLGLAICRALLDLHGGGIGLESRPGDGTRARAWLPRTPMPVLAA